MTIQVNNKLTKSRNPTEHGFKLENQKGVIVHTIDDGYNLIKFSQFKIKRLIRVDRKKTMKFVPLEWYVHENDFTKI